MLVYELSMMVGLWLCVVCVVCAFAYGVHVWCVYVCVLHGVWCVFCKGVGVCVCVDLFAVYKQALHAGTARCIFENSTVKNYFVANNTLW